MRFKVSSLLAVILFLLPVLSFAQQRAPSLSLDEIRKEIELLESQDDKLRTYIEMSNRYFRNAPDSLLVIAGEINQLEGVQEEKKEAFISFLNANAYRLMNADSTIFYASRASDKLRELGEHNSYLMMENLQAMQYARKDQYLEAESLYLDAISYRSELEEQVEYPIQFFYGNLGNLYVTVGAHDLAIQMFEKFLEHEDSPPNRCNILSKLATSFMELDDMDRAISTLSPCLEYENLPPPISAMVRSNLSSMYQREDLPRATQLMEEATSISSRYRVPNIGNSHLARLGNLYLDQGLVEEADSVGRIIRTAPPTPFSRPNEDIRKYEFLSELHLAKAEYSESLRYADQAIEIAEKHNLSRMMRKVYELKANAFEKTGDLDNALINERLQRTHENEINERRRERNEAMLAVRYQLKNKEAQLMDANLEIENIRLRNMLIIVGLILITGYVFYRYRLYYLLKEEKTRNQIARDLHDDLSGTLSSISFFSEAAHRVNKERGDSERFLNIITKSAVEAKEKINDIIWAIDPSKDDWSVFLKKCKRFAADVLDSNDIEYSFDMDEDFSFPVELQFRQNLWLIYKECITNLSKHSKATKVGITLQEKRDHVFLSIVDNGLGFDPESLKSGNGIDNIRYRAEQIQGTVDLESAPGEGTKWTFTFSIS
ncbi:tetratricopeptide repeat-containing sensor histidine kinase [Gracilimonas sp. BCB1]|uniref:tetratricopeptide repeat-containing sensor histidine kinase n=1 Tax=Gracilimonas sp. BCB1 TaxID=3152362 RepID=UPI003F82A4AB